MEGIGHNLFLFLLNLEIKKIFLFRFIENDRFSEMPFNCFGMDAEYQWPNKMSENISRHCSETRNFCDLLQADWKELKKSFTAK